MGFSGWSPEAVEFFEDLGGRQHQGLLERAQGAYEQSVRKPMAELLDELSGEFARGGCPALPGHTVPGRQVAVQNRDLRDLDRGGYVRFGADGLTAALGYYMMTAAQLERYRRAVDDRTRAPGWPGWWSGCVATGGRRSVAGRP